MTDVRDLAAAHRQSAVDGWRLSDGGEVTDVVAVVPGGVHESLVAASVLCHPYVDDNELAAAWVEDRTWRYHSTLTTPGDIGDDERLLLRFDALDGVATVQLGGEHLGTHRNQHRPAVYDITVPVAAVGDVPLPVEVVFTPTLAGLVRDEEATGTLERLVERTGRLGLYREPPDIDAITLQLARSRIRKATCSWGWDFAARLPSVGLQGQVWLVRQRTAALLGVDTQTTALDLDAATATVEVRVEVDTFAGAPAALEVTFTGPDGRRWTRSIDTPGASAVVSFDLDDVQPWWTHDLGGQPLYDLAVRLLADDGAVLDEDRRRVGVRTIELDRTPDPDRKGSRFRLVLNGVGTFQRGACWVPPSLMIGSVPDDTYVDLVAMARRGQMTMIRMWGGGLYGPDVFYDACDEQGVLVWQDFMFACWDYPDDDPDLWAEVEQEAVHQVRRLRGHASLALWAGNNEVQGIHELTTGTLDPEPAWGWRFFHQLLPTVMSEHAPRSLYWPGSPWGEVGLVNGVADGDRHAWEVWHGGDVGVADDRQDATPGESRHFRRYALDTGRFISEFGIHASPELATLRRWTAPGTLDLRSAAVDHRNKDNPKDKGWALMQVETGEPTTLRQYVDRSMAVQAEGLKFGVEHYRRRQPDCSGTLVWQLNDCWPGISWSVIDYDLVGKAAYWFLQRAYEPVIATFRASDDALELWVTSSARTAVDLTLDVHVGPIDGQPVTSERLEVTAEPGSSSAVWQGPRPPADNVARVLEANGRVPANRAFLAPLKDLPLDGTVTATRSRTGATTATITLRSSGYSYLARVSAPVPGVVFDRNYLDLVDGEEVAIHLEGLPPDLDLDRLEIATYASSDGRQR